jgi:hypothetical protein
MPENSSDLDPQIIFGAQATHRPKVKIFPYKENLFFVKTYEIEFEFLPIDTPCIFVA